MLKKRIISIGTDWRQMYGPVGKVYISNPIYWRKVKVKRASSVTQLLKLNFN